MEIPSQNGFGSSYLLSMFHNTKNLPNLTHLYVLYASNILAVYSKITLIMLFAPTSTTSILLCCFHIFHARTPTNIYIKERERERKMRCLPKSRVVVSSYKWSFRTSRIHKTFFQDLTWDVLHVQVAKSPNCAGSQQPSTFQSDTLDRIVYYIIDSTNKQSVRGGWGVC